MKYDKEARDRALSTWRKIHLLYESGAPGGEAEYEAQAREQYFFFRNEVAETLANLKNTLANGKPSIVLPVNPSP